MALSETDAGYICVIGTQPCFFGYIDNNWEFTKIVCEKKGRILAEIQTLHLIVKLLTTILIFMTVTSFDIKHSQDDFKFGIKYNSVRLKFGVPIISKNMIKQEGYGNWIVYNINKEPMDKPYHYSKAIIAFDDNKVYQEKDAYRQNLDDTTIRELDMDVFYDWEHNTVVI